MQRARARAGIVLSFKFDQLLLLRVRLKLVIDLDQINRRGRMDRRYRNFKLATLVSALVWAGLAQAGPVTDQMLAADPGDSWLHTNGNWSSHRYSTLSQLTPSNAKDLKVAWVFSPGGKADAQNT